MTVQVLFFNDFSEKDPHVNAVEQGQQPDSNPEPLKGTVKW